MVASAGMSRLVGIGTSLVSCAIFLTFLPGVPEYFDAGYNPDDVTNPDTNSQYELCFTHLSHLLPSQA